MKNLIPFSLTTAITFIVAVFTLLLSSCSMTTEELLPEATQISERIDIVFDGEISDEVFLQSTEADESINLVDYHVSADDRNVDFILNLDDNRKIVFNVIHENAAFWQQNGTALSMFAPQDLEDKTSYVTARMYDNQDAPVFVSHVGESFPRSSLLNVFRIVDYNPSSGEILCRLVDFQMAGSENAEDLITINGTFRGSIIDLN